MIGSYPMRWPCGPLEVALRQRQTPSLPDAVKANLLRWTAPESLDVLRGTRARHSQACLAVATAPASRRVADPSARKRPEPREGEAKWSRHRNHFSASATSTGAIAW
jgi:hypothetical protein